MTNEPASRQQAARLLDALDAADDLSCEQAREQISALVEAERAGEDVDTMPEYAALLRHLDRCAECMELYSSLAEDLEALVGPDETLPQASLTPPTFFAHARQSEGVALRVLRGLKRRFELTVPAPQLAPAIATLSGGRQISLFTDTLAEVAGAPVVSVSLSGAPTSADLLIAIREPAGTHWEVQLIAGDTVLAATTDERGIARFAGLVIAGVHDMTIRFVETAGAG